MTDIVQEKIKPKEFEAHYRSGKTPWDLGRPDFNLNDAVTQTPIEGCRALDIGCGTGQHSIWLAQQDFQVTGVDVSPTAIEKARENASRANVECTFLLAAFMEQELPGEPFGFIFDRGCWHLQDAEGRKRFSEKVAGCLSDGGLWLSLIGSADEPPRGSGPLAGPPRHSALDIVKAVETHFEILSLKASRFDSDHPTPPKAWVCLMKKRCLSPCAP